jgi:hypothetical protein
MENGNLQSFFEMENLKSASLVPTKKLAKKCKTACKYTIQFVIIFMLKEVLKSNSF